MFKSFIFGIVAITSLISGLSHAAGEKFQEQGNRLGMAMSTVLINEGACFSTQDCNDKELMFGGHGDRVNLSFYGIQDARLINSLISEAILFSSKSEFKVPVAIKFNFLPRAQLQGFRLKPVKPDISVEIK